MNLHYPFVYQSHPHSMSRRRWQYWILGLKICTLVSINFRRMSYLYSSASLSKKKCSWPLSSIHQKFSTFKVNHSEYEPGLQHIEIEDQEISSPGVVMTEPIKHQTYNGYDRVENVDYIMLSSLWFHNCLKGKEQIRDCHCNAPVLGVLHSLLPVVLHLIISARVLAIWAYR